MAKTDRRDGQLADMSFGVGPIADPTAPTEAEVLALTRIECGVVDDVDTPRTGSEYDIHALCDHETARKAGRIDNGTITGEAYKEFDGTDTFWALFDDTIGTPQTQYLVVCPAGYDSGGPIDVPVPGDVVNVYTVEVSFRSPLPLTANDSQRFGFGLTVQNVAFDSVIVV